MNINPIAIILVYSDSKGYRLLYRYPYRIGNNEKLNQIKVSSNNNSNTNGVCVNSAGSSTAIDSNNIANSTNNSSNSTTDVSNELKPNSSNSICNNNTNNNLNHNNPSTNIGNVSTRHLQQHCVRRSLTTNTSDSILKDDVSTASTSIEFTKRPRHRFSIQHVDDLLQPITPSAISSSSNIVVIKSGQLQSFADELLAPLFAVKPQLCNQKFELKINEVRFVSHPTLVQRREQPQHANSNIPTTVLNTGVTLSTLPVTSTATLTPSSPSTTSTLSMISSALNLPLSSSSTINISSNICNSTVCDSSITTNTITTVTTANQCKPINNQNNSNNNIQNHGNIGSKSLNSQIKSIGVTNTGNSNVNINANNHKINNIINTNNNNININLTNITAGSSSSSGGNSDGSSSIVTSASTSTTINQNQRPQPQQMLINIVFALHVQASYSIVKCYYDLSKRLGLALKVEEQRIGYINDETLVMIRTHDEIASHQQPLERAYDVISEQSTLAQSLKSIYHDLCSVGILNTTINQNLTLSFCLPAKAHQLLKKGSLVDPEIIDNCLKSLKPYHGMLLLVDFVELLDCVPPSGARMLLQLIEVYTPLMSLQSMASEADLSIEHAYKLVSHLVHWAKATIIYPLCETNVYVIAPDAPLHTKSHLVEKFAIRFPGMSLFEVISDFSLPTSIGHLTTPLQQSARQGILAQMVLWMLQRHLLVQLHTYVQFMPNNDIVYNIAQQSIYDCNMQQHQHHFQKQENSNIKINVDKDLIGTGRSNTDEEETDGSMNDEMVSMKQQVLDDDDFNHENIINLVVEHRTNNSRSMTDLLDSITTSNEDLSLPNLNNNENLSKDNFLSIYHDGDSLLSLSSPPLPVPNSNYHTMIEPDDRIYSGVSSVTSENVPVQASSFSHKSNFSVTTSISTDNENCDSIASIDDEERIKELLQIFNENDRLAIKRIPASANVDDLTLMVKLYQAGYFKSEHHLEEIMYFENLRRSQLLQLLDKFRDVLIIYETEDPAITSMYRHKLSND